MYDKIHSLAQKTPTIPRYGLKQGYFLLRAHSLYVFVFYLKKIKCIIAVES